MGSQGEIQFRDVRMKYREDSEIVLRGLSFLVDGGQKIGIVGRTGAGKSTICNVLTRIVELDGGSIVIDGADIATIKLEQLREKITVIPQDPALFTGTLQYNLDPTGTKAREEMLRVVEQAGLMNLLHKGDSSEETKGKQDCLDFEIHENGQNLSVGMRQVICICRAILRRNKIVILDEATANIDVVSEQTI